MCMGGSCDLGALAWNIHRERLIGHGIHDRSPLDGSGCVEEADLLSAGEEIVRVPPKLMAHARDAARTYGKSDPIDALAVARARDLLVEGICDEPA